MNESCTREWLNDHITIVILCQPWWWWWWCTSDRRWHNWCQRWLYGMRALDEKDREKKKIAGQHCGYRSMIGSCSHCLLAQWIPCSPARLLPLQPATNQEIWTNKAKVWCSGEGDDDAPWWWCSDEDESIHVEVKRCVTLKDPLIEPWLQ